MKHKSTKHLVQEVGSQLCQSETGPSRERKKRRSRKLSRLFGSDAEEERREESSSVVSDNPHLYERSISMVSHSPISMVSHYSMSMKNIF